MTNANITDVVSKVDGPVLTLTPKGQQIQITVPDMAKVVRIDLGTLVEVVKVGDRTTMIARPEPDGRLKAARVYVGDVTF